jgi:polyhydroxybutyrate depolymerase
MLRIFVLLGLLTGCGSPRSAGPDAQQKDAAVVATDAAQGIDSLVPRDGAIDVFWMTMPPVVFDDPAGLHAPVTLHAPSDYVTSPWVARPLVIFLHGYAGNLYAGWDQIEAQEILYLVPRGLTDAQGGHFWNASVACCDRDGRGNDDVAFLGGLIDEVVAAGWNVDRSRVAVIGASNGGFMAERMACARADVVTQIVDLAGAGQGSGDPACMPVLPVAAIVDHSEGDKTVLFDGGQVSIVKMAPAPAVLGAGGTTDRGDCRSLSAVPGLLDHDATVTGAETTVEQTNCNRGSLMFWSEPTSAHVFEPTAAWGDDVWAWMQAHPRS